MIKQEDVYRIGRLGKPHGVRGELSFQFEDDIFDRVDADYLILDIDGILVPFFIEEYRFRSNEICLLKLCDIDTEERARELTGCDVFFPRALAQEEDGGASWAEIIGFKVIDATGRGAPSGQRRPHLCLRPTGADHHHDHSRRIVEPVTQ